MTFSEILEEMNNSGIRQWVIAEELTTRGCPIHQSLLSQYKNNKRTPKFKMGNVIIEVYNDFKSGKFPKSA